MQGGPHPCRRRRRLVMAAEQLFEAVRDGQLDDVRQLLDEGVHPNKFRNTVSAAPAGDACADVLCWGAPLASSGGSRR